MKIILKDIFRNLSGGVCAGLCIALGCVVNLSVGGPLGSSLFSLGLLCVLLWRFPLYTGLMGFTSDWYTTTMMVPVLLGNILGCALLGTSVAYCRPELSVLAADIIAKHMSYDWVKVLIMSGWCGFIMTAIVMIGRMQPRRYLLPVVLGVMAFILSGFIHSIADAGYIFMMSFDRLSGSISEIVKFYLLVVLGNYIGGNLVRLIRLDWGYSNN